MKSVEMQQLMERENVNLRQQLSEATKKIDSNQRIAEQCQSRVAEYRVVKEIIIKEYAAYSLQYSEDMKSLIQFFHTCKAQSSEDLQRMKRERAQLQISLEAALKSTKQSKQNALDEAERIRKELLAAQQRSESLASQNLILTRELGTSKQELAESRVTKSALASKLEVSSTSEDDGLLLIK